MTDEFDNRDEAAEEESRVYEEQEDDSDYEKFCFLCRRPESQTGKMIELPNQIHICSECMQKSFDTMNQQMSNGKINYSDLMNMPNISMIDLSSFQNPMNQPKKIKRKSRKETGTRSEKHSGAS